MLHLLLLGLLKLLQEFPQAAVPEAQTVSCRRSHRDHVIGVFCTHRSWLTHPWALDSQMLVEISPRPRSSWTLILCTCRLVGRNSSFLSPLRWLALKDGPEENTPEHEPPEPRPTQKNLTSVVPEVRQGLLVAHQNRLELGDDLTPKVLPAGRQLAELLQLTHPDHKETPEEPSPWSGPSAGSYWACFQQQPCVCGAEACPLCALPGRVLLQQELDKLLGDVE